jgi:hypothetical protein
LGGFKNHRPNAHYLSTHTPRSVKALLKRADKAVVKAPVASRRSKMVIKVIKVVVNKITSFQ